jgi:hypothetical protein
MAENLLNYADVRSGHWSQVEKLAYSVEEVTEATGLTRSLIYDEMGAGRLG